MPENETIIDRVKRMELYFDTLTLAASCGLNSIFSDPPVRAMLDELMAYYENGQWLSDYLADDRGELPSDLKRGVLSQDGVYNLLYDIDRVI